MDARCAHPSIASSSASPYPPATYAAAHGYAPDRAGSEHEPREVKRTPNEPDGARAKKSRQTQSCDACRARKVKCDRAPPRYEHESGLPIQDACSHCRSMGMSCTFEYKPKKRGPPNLYVKKMQERSMSSASLGSAAQPAATPAASIPAGAWTASRPPAPYLPPDGSPRDSPRYAWPTALPLTDGGSPVDRLTAPAPAPPVSLPEWTTSPAGAVSPDHFAAGPSLHGSSGALHAAGTTLPIPTPPLSSSPAFSPGHALHPEHRHLHPSSRPGNPLDALIPRGLLLLVIRLYFDYIWCLIPCVHRPSFMRDLEARREERPGQDEWVALVLAVVGTTLVQMPSSFVPLERYKVKQIVQRCLAHGVQRILVPPDNLTERLILLYLLVALSSLAGRSLMGRLNMIPYIQGDTYTRDMIMGVGHAIANRLRLQDARSYENLDPIEAEVRKRLFWLQYGADRTQAYVESHGMFWSETDIDVPLPRMLDDQYVTADGYLDPPPGEVPVISGFYYISKLFALLGEALDKRRRDQKNLPHGLLLQMRINEVDQLFDQVLGLMDNCPEPLRLDMAGTPGARMDLLQEGWDAVAAADVKQLLSVTHVAQRERSPVRDAFLVQQANIYVTQQLVRYMIIQYRDELGALQDLELQANSGAKATASARGLGSRRGLDRVGFSEQEKDLVASDLLMILSKISIQIIAVNSTSLISKIRLVASTLLDALKTSPTPMVTAQLAPETLAADAQATERTAKAQGYLWDFLRILSEIEAAYTLEDHAAGPAVTGGG
ncbi:hypothetical protein Q5752_000288 [Cryptotrichosporon argae]